MNLSNLDVSQIVGKDGQISDKEVHNTINDISLLDTQYNDILKQQEFNPLQVMTIKEKEELDKKEICGSIIEYLLSQTLLKIERRRKAEEDHRKREQERIEEKRRERENQEIKQTDRSKN